MPTQAEKCSLFRALHVPGKPLVMPNPWDAGSARILAALGFKALATTSAGHSFALGRRDVARLKTREEALANARDIASAVDLPVSGDLENLYAESPEAAAETIALAAEAGLAGCSIEDASGDDASPIYQFDLALARVKAAVAAARRLPFPFMLTARAENLIFGRKDLPDTIRRLKAFEDAGADVLYAPGLAKIDEVRAVVGAVKKPVNVLVSGFNSQMTVDDLARANVARISVGGALARAAIGALISGAREIQDRGTFTYAKTAPSASQIEALFEKGSS